MDDVEQPSTPQCKFETSQETLTSIYNTKFHYKLATIFFTLQFLLFLLQAIFLIIEGSYSLTDDAWDTIMSLVLQALVLQTGAVLLASLALSLVVFQYSEKHPLITMHLAPCSCILMLLSFTGLQSYLQHYIFAVLGAAYAVFITFQYQNAKIHFEMSAALLKVVSRAAHKNPSLFVLLTASIFVAQLYGNLANVALTGLMAVATKWTGLSTAFLGIFFTFSVWWTVQVIFNTIRFIVAGVYASTYHSNDSPVGSPTSTISTTTEMQRPVVTMIEHTFRYSFGAICYSSLLLAPISKVSGILWSILESVNGPKILWRILNCMAGNFNYMAYNRVSIQNQLYKEACASTWNLISTSSVKPIVRDNYVGTCLSLLSLSIALISAFFHIILKVIYFGGDAPMFISGFLGSALLGYIIPQLLFSILDAGTLATLTCMADNMQPLRSLSPHLYSSLIQKYPSLTDST